jgi:hypothetical protein
MLRSLYNQQKSNFEASDWTGLGNVRVINLTDARENYKQDLLVTAPVPEGMESLNFHIGSSHSFQESGSSQ